VCGSTGSKSGKLPAQIAPKDSVLGTEEFFFFFGLLLFLDLLGALVLSGVTAAELVVRLLPDEDPGEEDMGARPLPLGARILAVRAIAAVVAFSPALRLENLTSPRSGRGGLEK